MTPSPKDLARQMAANLLLAYLLFVTWVVLESIGVTTVLKGWPVVGIEVWSGRFTVPDRLLQLIPE